MELQSRRPVFFARRRQQRGGNKKRSGDKQVGKAAASHWTRSVFSAFVVSCMWMFRHASLIVFSSSPPQFINLINENCFVIVASNQLPSVARPMWKLMMCRWQMARVGHSLTLAKTLREDYYFKNDLSFLLSNIYDNIHTCFGYDLIRLNSGQTSPTLLKMTCSK